MKRTRPMWFVVALLAIVAGISSMAGAQAPSINSGGVVTNGTWTQPIIYNQVWAIFGSELSPCTTGSSCSQQTSRVFINAVAQDQCNNPAYVFQFSLGAGSSWWYESPTQINVLPQPNPGNPLQCVFGPDQIVNGDVASLTVCDENTGVCSAWYNFVQHTF